MKITFPALVLTATCLLLLGCDTKTKAVDSCGDNFLDPGEQCDGRQLTVDTCTGLGYYEQTDTLTCLSDCTFDLTVCTGGKCGDGIIQGVHREDCDGENLAETTCQELGLGGGTLRCKNSCRWDTAGCEVSAVCGDGTVASPFEKCEPMDLQEKTCETFGYYAGELACAEDCREFDVSDCESAGRCGDEIFQESQGEVCEVDDLRGATCESQGYYGGTLLCGTDCRSYDESGCTGSCGDGEINGEEECDRTALGGHTCDSLGFYEGELACDEDCRLDTTACMGICGDGMIQETHGETCDGMNLGGATCASQGYSARSGALTCTAGCLIDDSACVTKLGNANLATLTISNGDLTPVFSANTVSYTSIVPFSVESLTMAATAADAPYATVAFTPGQPMALIEGTNAVTVTVTAENGTEKVYTVTVTRQPMLKNCSNGIDDDGDGKTDCADPDCRGLSCGSGCICAYGAKHENNCNDGLDNDGDGLPDCMDPLCAVLPVCGGGNENCSDGIDNDGDSYADCFDAACQLHSRCIPWDAPGGTTPWQICNTLQPYPCNAGRTIQGPTPYTCKPVDNSCY